MPYVQPQAAGYTDPQALAAATAGIHASGATVQFELRTDTRGLTKGHCGLLLI